MVQRARDTGPWPTGGTAGFMKKKNKRKRTVNIEWCKGCGICVAFCPKGVMDLDESEKAAIVRPDDCIDCGMCELRCPDLAIESEEIDAA